MPRVNLATNWRAVQREDGSIFFECGTPEGSSCHMAFDVALDDLALAQRFCRAINILNTEWKPLELDHDRLSDAELVTVRLAHCVKVRTVDNTVL